MSPLQIAAYTLARRELLGNLSRYTGQTTGRVLECLAVDAATIIGTGCEPVCTPPAQTAVVVVAHPLAASGGGCAYKLRRRFFSVFSRSRNQSLIPPMAMIATNAMAISPSTGYASTGFMQVFLWFVVFLCAVVLGNVIFHWVINPAFELLARRFA